MKTKLNIIQHNLNEQIIVSEQLRDLIAKNKMNIALIQESATNPNEDIFNEGGYKIFKGECITIGVAIIVADKNL